MILFNLFSLLLNKETLENTEGAITKGKSRETGNLGYTTGADPGFQVRGGALKKITPSGGGAKNFGVFRVKNYDFTPKNYIFSNCGGRRENFWGISCEKSRFYAKKSYFFQF